MKYYQSETGEVFGYESDGSQDAFIVADLVLMSDEDFAAFLEKQAHDSAPSHEDLLNMAGAKRDELLTLAGIRIAPLQYASDLDEATTAEKAALKQWKQYCLAVSRVSGQAGYPEIIEWPEQPQQ